IQVILEQARAVLGVASCGILTLDPVTRELTLSASLDLPDALVDEVRIPEGEGIAGRAVGGVGPRHGAAGPRRRPSRQRARARAALPGTGGDGGRAYPRARRPEAVRGGRAGDA